MKFIELTLVSKLLKQKKWSKSEKNLLHFYFNLLDFLCV